MTVRIILYSVITLLVIFPACQGLRGGSGAICRSTVSQKQSRYVPYTETYRATLSRRIRTRTNYKIEYHTVYTTDAVCCDGYKNSGGYCVPICRGSCTNGTCLMPNFCECNQGYALNFSGEECIPVCAISCNYGKCTAPETCTCDEGYRSTPNRYNCEPVCSSACDNGYCAGPNVCVCNSGYAMNDADKCEPICERPCVNGKCVAPDICTCNDGFQRSKDDDFTCEPKCSKPCVFGSCTAPDICTCNEGYEKSNGSNFTCAPICGETCVFGDCIFPDTCSCNDGYVLKPESEYICEPLCEDECGHGNCVQPNVCECHDGYVKSSGVCTCNPGFRYNSTRKDCDPVCTEPCINALCESPETCACLEGYKRSSANSSECEAVCENCTNGLCKTPGECICNEGFIKDETDGKTCVNSCKPECVNGACSATGCTCDFGWGGDSCEESLLCFVSKPSQDILRNHAASHVISGSNESKSTQNVAIRKLDGPACNPRCLSEVNSSTISIQNTLTNETRYFLPMGSPCNIAMAQAMILKTYVSMIGVIVGGVLCAIVVYSVYIIRTKRNHKSKMNSGSRECIYKEEAEEDGLNNSCFDDTHSL